MTKELANIVDLLMRMHILPLIGAVELIKWSESETNKNKNNSIGLINDTSIASYPSRNLHGVEALVQDASRGFVVLPHGD